MQRIANWTNLSETTFVSPPRDPAADYRIRIFTPAEELPFAGHPTLGSCHAWLQAGGQPATPGTVVQECADGQLVTVRQTADGLAFAAPRRLRDGPVDPALRTELAVALGIDASKVVDAAWADNGPGWVAVLLAGADEVLSLRPPGTLEHKIGVVGPYRAGADAAFEVRAFFDKGDSVAEDPVTGSLNASLAQWLLGSGRAQAPYVAAQGTALGRAGRVHVTRDDDGTIWVGGGTVTCVTGELRR
jgi:PhzF family phenazine biosynthesis protein